MGRMAGRYDRGVVENFPNDALGHRADLQNYCKVRNFILRKQRIDSASAAVTAMVGAAAGELDPPEHISVPEKALPFWRAIIRARAREDWLAAPSLMNAAANLAWTQWQIDNARRQIDGGSPIDEGTTAAQLGSMLLKMQRLEMGYLRVLQQHGRGVGGESRAVSRRTNGEHELLDDNPMDDDLLARPSIQ